MRWTVIHDDGGRYVLCRCACGTEKLVSKYSLTYGTSQSCGCMRGEQIAESNRLKPPGLRHGQSKTRLYGIWRTMRDRSGKRKHYEHVAVCDEWHVFEVFHGWALANGYTDELTIDRVKNELGYEPDNCRWITRKEQNRNLTTNRPVERSDGVRYGSCGEAAEANGCTRSQIINACAGRAKTARGYGWRYL